MWVSCAVFDTHNSKKGPHRVTTRRGHLFTSGRGNRPKLYNSLHSWHVSLCEAKFCLVWYSVPPADPFNYPMLIASRKELSATRYCLEAVLWRYDRSNWACSLTCLDRMQVFFAGDCCIVPYLLILHQMPWIFAINFTLSLCSLIHSMLVLESH